MEHALSEGTSRSVKAFVLRPAREIAVARALPLRLAGNLVTHYWRRANMVRVPAYGLRALAVIDQSLMKCLVGLKVHLMHAPRLQDDLRATIQAAQQDIQQTYPGVFAHTCLHLLALQAGVISSLPTRLWSDWLPSQPDAVFDAMRWCFDPTVADYLTRGVPEVFASDHTALMHLLVRLGIARAGVSEEFALALSRVLRPRDGGLIALCEWRCTGLLDEGKALSAVRSGSEADADAALLTLALAAHTDAVPLAHALLARVPSSAVALALCVANQSEPLVRALQAPERLPLPPASRLYACAMLGSAALLEQASVGLEWTDATQARAMADAVALLTGKAADSLHDRQRSAEQRRADLATVLATLPAAAGNVRTGQPRDGVLIADSALAVGAPLRRMLYAEYAGRTPGALYLQADDLAETQSLGLSAASAFEAWSAPRLDPRLNRLPMPA